LIQLHYLDEDEDVEAAVVGVAKSCLEIEGDFFSVAGDSDLAALVSGVDTADVGNSEEDESLLNEKENAGVASVFPLSAVVVVGVFSLSSPSLLFALSPLDLSSGNPNANFSPEKSEGADVVFAVVVVAGTANDNPPVVDDAAAVLKLGAADGKAGPSSAGIVFFGANEVTLVSSSSLSLSSSLSSSVSSTTSSILMDAAGWVVTPRND
jgi:hypothetical protein